MKKEIHSQEPRLGKPLKIQKTENKHIPDPRKHKIISLIKSLIRIAGYTLLLINLPIAVGVLILSEVLGIIEELI